MAIGIGHACEAATLIKRPLDIVGSIAVGDPRPLRCSKHVFEVGILLGCPACQSALSSPSTL